MDLFEYTFFQNAILGSLLASILCGIVGTYIVTRRLVFISGGITHASFGGIGLGVFLGINPILSAMVFAVASSLGVQWLSQRGHIREDSTIAFFWTLGMSIGIICCFLTPGFMPDLNSFLFGSLLTIDSADLLILAVLTLVVAVFTMLFFGAIVSVAFDPIFARAQRLPVAIIEYVLMAVIALTIVATLRMVGIVLAISLLTIPQMTANVFTYSYKRMIVLSIVVGWIDCMAGLALSYWLNVPSGATIIFVGIVVYAVVRIAKMLIGRNGAAIASIAMLATLMLTGCSTQKNTASARWWHAFKARYNTYYNGSMAYIDASLEKENGNRDNFTELLPLYMVNNKNSRELGKANYERAITKAEKAIHQHSIKRRPVWDKQRRKTARDIEWLSRREYNPFLWKAWMLMGRSQFHMGAFDEAASTFAYMSRLYATQPAIYGKAKAWLAKCYVEEGWMYDAEDVIRNMVRDSMDWRAVKEWDYTYADYHIHAGNYDKAIPYMRRVIGHEMRRKQKAREWFLLGQLYAAVGKNDSAYRAFRHVIRLNPPYELEFNARIAQTEVMAKGRSRSMIGRLKRMASSDNNKDYLDQIYYAIGNIYLADGDTARAIGAYERGNTMATRSGIEKGVLLLRLGNLYWDKEKFSDARRCYGEAIGLLDTDRKDYKQLSDRSKILDELVPHTDAVALQDSLQTLARMDEKERNAAIDRVIDALKKKEKEERRAQQEANAQQMQNESAANNDMGNRQNGPTTKPGTQTGNGQWYFYNPIAVSQGKATFQKLWGKRENVDNWQRINKTVVPGMGGATEWTDAQRDSIEQQVAKEDSLEALKDSAQNDPHKREYYLAQIPFTPEQVAESDALIMDGLFHAGVIFKDKLDNLRLGEKFLTRLANQYSTYTGMDEVYYHLYLLYMRQQHPEKAQHYLELLKAEYAKSVWTTTLTDPYFAENAREGEHMEDSLYAATYNAFKANRTSEISRNVALSGRRFPMGANRDKFLFIGALNKLNLGEADSCLADLNKVVSDYPQSEISTLAGMIINGVKAGRQLRSGQWDMDEIWNRRTSTLNHEGADSVRTFSNERNTEFRFVIVYQPDSINANQLLFELARYNFTNYMVRNFEIDINDNHGLCHMEVSGFRNYDEALQYARQLFGQGIIQRYPDCRTLIISNTNLELIGKEYSYDDYARYYDKHFVPLKISTFQLLAEPEEIVTRPSSQPSIEEIDDALGDGFVMDTSETEPTPQNGTLIPSAPEAESQAPTTGTLIPSEPTTTESQAEGTIIASPEEPTAKEKKSTSTGVEVITTPKKTITTKPEVISTPKKTITTPQKTTPATSTAKPATKPATSKTGFYFGDKTTKVPADTTKNKKATPKKKKFDLEDEYYDLEGF